MIARKYEKFKFINIRRAITEGSGESTFMCDGVICTNCLLNAKRVNLTCHMQKINRQLNIVLINLKYKTI